MTTYSIGEVADRSGFTASALRYYEGIGLVAPATRTDAGYRVYGEETLVRLKFISRAKQLGGSLEEITDLVGIWDGQHCGPVQRRFHELVSTKIVGAQGQIAELIAFTAQLQAAATQLSSPPTDGPCREACACLADAPAAVEPVGLTPDPIACTLDPGSMPGRIAEWRSILDQARARTLTADGGVRVEFDSDTDLGELARLVAAEQRCCAFLSFAITVDGRGVALEVRAPGGAADIVTSLFGSPA